MSRKNPQNMLLLCTERGGKDFQISIMTKIREKMVRINKCFQRVIFDVLSRYRSIAGEHMRNRENNKYDSGRIHPGIYKNKQCVLPLSTR
jgi:hypothetical protein